MPIVARNDHIGNTQRSSAIKATAPACPYKTSDGRCFTPHQQPVLSADERIQILHGGRGLNVSGMRASAYHASTPAAVWKIVQRESGIRAETFAYHLRN